MDILLELKTRTQEAHTAIEALVPLMRDDATLLEYEAYLRAFLGFIEPLEEQLERVPHLSEALPDWPLRIKSELLRVDLRALGEREWDVDSVTQCHHLPKLRSVPAAMGCLYVLEGSTLGGHVLLRHLRLRLGSQFEQASRFLTSYGPNLGSMWRTFGDHLRAVIVTDTDRAIAIWAAEETFGSLLGWLEASSSHWSPLMVK